MKRPRCSARRGGVGLPRAPVGAWAGGRNPQSPSPNPNPAPNASLDISLGIPRELEVTGELGFGESAVPSGAQPWARLTRSPASPYN